MLPIIVIPFLNEEASLEATCRSLGFGAERSGTGAVLVLVDNGSTDGSSSLAMRIRDRSPPGDVVVVYEGERGYVPARRAGAAAAAQLAARASRPAQEVLLLQADADTIYEDGYVQATMGVAAQHGPGHLYEGVSIPPERRLDPCRLFRELERAIDDSFPMVPEEMDVVVDDKVASCFLSDYVAWGGHRREYSDYEPFEEFLAETTRLFLRARLCRDARRVRVPTAMATTSSRRILEDPALAFATAGFPRGHHWRVRWHESYSGPNTLAAFRPGSSFDLDQAIAMRLRYLTMLFRCLPEELAGRMVVRERSSQAGGVPDVSTEVPRIIAAAFDRAGIR